MDGEKDLASITSVVGRFPVFDFMDHNGICYMRFKKEIVFAKSNYGMVYIIPTDDMRIKFVITPYSGEKEDLISQVQNNIATMSE